MPKNTQLILAVDDEISDRERMLEILQSQGYAVLAAGDFTEAVHAFRDRGDEIVLLISDISMPGKNGCDLAKELLAIKPDLKVLFVSGHVGLEVCRFYGLAPSDQHFLRKPFELEEFLARVREILSSNEPVPGLRAAAHGSSDASFN
jgi:two-component system, cell cycle sensor histidine kinase and response regulator CckA